MVNSTHAVVLSLQAAIGEVELEFDSSSSDDEGAGGGAGAGAGAGSTNAAAVTPIGAGVDDGDGTDTAGPHVDTAGTPRSLTSPRMTNRGSGTPKTPKIRVGDYDPTKCMLLLAALPLPVAASSAVVWC